MLIINKNATANINVNIVIDTTLQPIRKSIKDIEYDVKEVNLQLGLKAGPNEMSAFERRLVLIINIFYKLNLISRFEMYCTEYQFK